MTDRGYRQEGICLTKYQDRFHIRFQSQPSVCKRERASKDPEQPAMAVPTNLKFNDLRGTAVTRLALAECTEIEIAAITGLSMKQVG